MKRLAFLLILVSVTASLTGCRRGFPLFGRGNQCGPTCGTPAPSGMFGGAFQAAPPACEYAPPAISAPAYSAPMMMTAPAGCDCGANAAPMGNSYVMGSTPNSVPGMNGMQGMNGTFMGSDSMNGMPANAMSTMPMGMSNQVFPGQAPMNAGYGMNVIGDRVLGRGEMIAPDTTVKVGQK